MKASEIERKMVDLAYEALAAGDPRSALRASARALSGCVYMFLRVCGVSPEGSKEAVRRLEGRVMEALDTEVRDVVERELSTVGS